MADYIIDGKEKVLGRVGSQVAKLLLLDNNVTIINSELMVITGHNPNIIARYKQLIELKDKANPEHSPYWPRRPDMFVKRVIRGMLPYKRPKGKSAFKKLRVYIGVPDAFKSAKHYDIKSKKPSEIFESTISVKQLTEKLGYKI